MQPGYPPQQGYPQQQGPAYGPPPPQYAPQQAPPPPAYQPQPYQPAPAAPAPAPTGQGGTQPGQWAKPEAVPSDRVTATALENHLLIVVPISYHPAFFEGKPAKFDAQGVQTEAAKDPSNAICVNVVDLDGIDQFGQPGKTYLGVMWGGKVLAEGLNRQIGVAVLARMAKGQARGTNAAPLILNDASADPQACARADQFVNRRPNWQNEPNVAPAAPVQQPYQPQPYPQDQPAPYAPQQGYQPAPGMSAPGVAPQYGPPQHQQYAPQQQGDALVGAYGQPAPQGYPPQGQQPGPYGQPQQGYPQQQAAPYAPQGGYQPGTAGPTSPEAQAAYANVAAQQYPQQYQQ